MAGDFSPNKYADERRKKIMKFLEKKAREKGTVEAPELEEEEVEGPVDLVAVLERSMRKVKKKR
jgi:non-homologous end joining protein Ku